MALEHWLHLRLADGLGPKLTGRLLERCGNAAAACCANAATLRQVNGIGKTKADAIANELASARPKVDAELARADRLGVRLICKEDETYPPLLRAVDDAPTVLWLRGDLQPRDLNGLAIVGSRDCSNYGREQAQRFATWLAGAGFTVVSGGARGIDAAAHRGALQHPAGRTIAVLGCGVDVAYPSDHEKLFAEIAGGRGAVMSEYPLGTEPRRENFPPRNRIISGLSRGVLVVEAAERSGAHITARVAIEEQGRSVMAMPGRIDNPASAGPHQLIREGATLVAHPDQIPDELGPMPESATSAVVSAPTEPELFETPPTTTVADVVLGEEERAIVRAVGGETLTADALIAATRLPTHVVMRSLTTLTLKGRLERVGGQTYRAKR